MKTFLKILFLNIVLFGYTNAQWEGRITIASSVNTHFIVTNPQGYKTGYDPRGKTDYSHSDVKEDIPESDYGISGIGSLSGNNDIWGIECSMTLFSTDAAGKYHLLLIGTSLDTFWVNVFCSKRINGVIKDREKFLIEGVLDHDSTLSYDFVFPLNDDPYLLQKNVSINSIRQDIYAMRKVNWISTQAVADKYTGLFATYNTQMQQNNFSGARTTLNTVIQNLIADSTSAITIDAYKSLRADTDQLLSQLSQQLIVSIPELLDSLHSRLQQAYTNGWIGDQLLVQTLDRNIQDAKSKYTAKDSIGCAQEIESFYKIVRLQYLATLKIRGKKFVTGEAYNLLYSFAKGIIEKVLTLPPRSLASLIDQVTVLRAQIRIDASQGLLGGELLLKGLEFSLDAAKQRLQKKDSIGTALYVTLFQQTVRQTHELTKKLPKSKLYVKPGGYISLYYRAGYILEELLEPVGQPMPKMDSILNKELQQYEKEAIEQMRK